MESLEVVETECIDRGALIIFDDGVSALFSASFLHAHLDDADEVVRDVLKAFKCSDAA
jgi:hypothetical protein